MWLFRADQGRMPGIERRFERYLSDPSINRMLCMQQSSRRSEKLCAERDRLTVDCRLKFDFLEEEGVGRAGILKDRLARVDAGQIVWSSQRHNFELRLNRAILCMC